MAKSVLSDKLLDLAIGGLLLVGYLLFTRTSLIRAASTLKRADWVNLFLLSSLGTSLSLLLIVAGFGQTSAIKGGFLLQLNGVAALIFSVLLLRERIQQKQVIGIPLLLLGSSLVVFKGTEGKVDGSGNLGNLLILAGAIGLGFGFIPAKRLAGRIDTLSLTTLRLLLGACTLLPVVIFRLITTHSLLWQPSLITLCILLPSYIFTNFCLSYLFQQEGLRLLRAWEAAAIMQTIPLFSAAFTLFLLHDSITLMQVGGGLLALIGGLAVSLNNEAPKPNTPTTFVAFQKEPAKDLSADRPDA